MFIKSHIRGGFRSAAAYLKEQGENEKTRLVHIADPHAQDLDEAFKAMWAVSYGTKVKVPLHHVSINPMKHERLTDDQVLKICERLEENYGYRPGGHQKVIVEHIKDGRQHFHVMWNRVSFKTGKSHYPKMHKKISKLTARQVEIEFGLERLSSARANRFRFPKTVLSRMPQRERQGLERIKHYIEANRPSIEGQNQAVSGMALKNSTMSEEQQIDLKAAMEGKITWHAYFQKWGIKMGGLNI